MSIADHFEHIPDGGFVRDYDGDTARRQFNVSLVLVVIILLAATALGFLVHFDSPAQTAASAFTPIPQAPPIYAGRL